jgi:large subunit ribosomal protein L10
MEKRQPKQFKVDEVKGLTDMLSSAKSAVFVNYAGLSVKGQQELKNTLKEGKAKMLVAKNTLFKIAAKNANLPADFYTDTVLSGQTALVTSNEEAVASVQTLGKFIKEKEIGQLKAGVIEGGFYNESGLLKLSTLPSKEVLYAQVVGGVAAPLYALVGTLQSNLQKLVFVLDQYRVSKQ